MLPVRARCIRGMSCIGLTIRQDLMEADLLLDVGIFKARFLAETKWLSKIQWLKKFFKWNLIAYSYITFVLWCVPGVCIVWRLRVCRLQIHTKVSRELHREFSPPPPGISARAAFFLTREACDLVRSTAAGCTGLISQVTRVRHSSIAEGLQRRGSSWKFTVPKELCHLPVFQESRNMHSCTLISASRSKRAKLCITFALHICVNVLP